LPEDWISQFCNILEMAEMKAKERKHIIDDITSAKIAGICKAEQRELTLGSLMMQGQIALGPVFLRYIDEVYGEDPKEGKR
jgi:hypothetical protein